MPNIEYLLPNIGRTAAPGDAAGEEQCPQHHFPLSWHPKAPLQLLHPPQTLLRCWAVANWDIPASLSLENGDVPTRGDTGAPSPLSPVTSSPVAAPCPPATRGTPTCAHPHAANPETGSLLMFD